MSVRSIYRKLLGLNVIDDQPALKIATFPLTVNGVGDVRGERNVARMARLRQRIAEGDSRPDLKEELERRERWGR